tara:strand:- start:785 stop:1123 length:339 start_codon:yes stop_codon:yes gene_type:complete
MKRFSYLPVFAFLDMDWSSFVTYMIESVECAFKTVLFWIIDTVLELLEPLFESALTSLPSAPSTVSNTLNVFSYANYFLPVSEILSLFSFFLVFLATYSAIKIVVKLIPTVG